MSKNSRWGCGAYEKRTGFCHLFVVITLTIFDPMGIKGIPSCKNDLNECSNVLHRCWLVTEESEDSLLIGTVKISNYFSSGLFKILLQQHLKTHKLVNSVQERRDKCKPYTTLETFGPKGRIEMFQASKMFGCLICS